MRVFLEKVMLRRPDVIEAALVGELRYVQRIVEQRALGLARPRPRKLHQVYAAKFHRGAFLVQLRSVFYANAEAL